LTPWWPLHAPLCEVPVKYVPSLHCAIAPAGGVCANALAQNNAPTPNATATNNAFIAASRNGILTGSNRVRVALRNAGHSMTEHEHLSMRKPALSATPFRLRGTFVQVGDDENVCQPKRSSTNNPGRGRASLIQPCARGQSIAARTCSCVSSRSTFAKPAALF